MSDTLKYKINLIRNTVQRNYRRGRRIFLQKIGMEDSLQQKLENIKSKDKLKIVYCYSHNMIDDLRDDEDFSIEIITIQELLESESRKSNKADLFVLRSSGTKEDLIALARENFFADTYITWMWDNHHSFEGNLEMAMLSDTYFYAHKYISNYLEDKHPKSMGHLAVSCCQFSKKSAAEQFTNTMDTPRVDNLFGEFIEYPGLDQRRNKLILECIKHFPESSINLSKWEDTKYWELSARERFTRWRRHKVSLSLPSINDLGCRLFDALVTGQIPIVPNDVYDLDDVISPKIQKELPIVRLEEYTVDCVKDAHQRALLLYDTEGEAGVLKRHQYVMNNHMEIHRFRDLMQKVLSTRDFDKC